MTWLRCWKKRLNIRVTQLSRLLYTESSHLNLGIRNSETNWGSWHAVWISWMINPLISTRPIDEYQLKQIDRFDSFTTNWDWSLRDRWPFLLNLAGCNLGRHSRQIIDLTRLADFIITSWTEHFLWFIHFWPGILTADFWNPKPRCAATTQRIINC